MHCIREKKAIGIPRGQWVKKTSGITHKSTCTKYGLKKKQREKKKQKQTHTKCRYARISWFSWMKYLCAHWSGRRVSCVRCVNVLPIESLSFRAILVRCIFCWPTQSFSTWQTLDLNGLTLLFFLMHKIDAACRLSYWLSRQYPTHLSAHHKSHAKILHQSSLFMWSMRPFQLDIYR